MEWRINYQELSDYYFDGYAYQIDDMGKADPTKFCGFGGISVLNDHKQKLLAQKIEALPEKSGDKGLKKAAAAVRQWKLLGQELTHFHDQMEQRDCRAFRRPYDEEIPGSPYRLDEVLGFTSPDPDFFQRICQQIEGIPYVKGNVLPPYRFLRKGKAYLADLIFYDAFGRGLQLIRSGQGYGLYQSENFPLMIADSMKAKQRHEGNGFLLKPCILQYCRLAATLWGQGERPFFGFLTLNRLNHSLLVHSAEGEALGELMLMAVDGQKRRVCFVPFAGQPCPELAYFIQAQEGKEEADFQAFLDTIDASFWTMDAAGKHGDERMALLAGRPLAMSRLELYFDIYGLPRKDAGWGNDGEKKGLEPEPEKFPLRLGSLPVREDGICGYFADNTFSLFHSIASPQTLVPSLSQIGKKGPASQEAYLHVGYDHEQAANPYVSVSYTHLDVYKRQNPRSGPTRCPEGRGRDSLAKPSQATRPLYPGKSRAFF